VLLASFITSFTFTFAVDLQTKWEETEDKPAAVLITGGAILLLITLSGVVDAVDKIPIISDLIELVGVVVTGW
jgi:hypothetical protein